MVFSEKNDIFISVTNVLGEVIKQDQQLHTTEANFNLDLSPYGNGIYFVTVQAGAGKITRRIVLNR